MLHICNAGRMLFRHIFNLWLLTEPMNTETQIANYRIKSIFSSLQIFALSVPCVSHWPPASLPRFYPWKITTVALYEGALPGGHCFWEYVHGQTTTCTFKSQAKEDPQKESRSSFSLDTPAFLRHRVSTPLLGVVSPYMVQRNTEVLTDFKNQGFLYSFFIFILGHCPPSEEQAGVHFTRMLRVVMQEKGIRCFYQVYRILLSVTHTTPSHLTLAKAIHIDMAILGGLGRCLPLWCVP